MFWLLLACGPPPEVVAERDELRAQVEGLEQTVQATEAERDAWKSRAGSLQERLDEQRIRETYSRLGLESGQALIATLDTTHGELNCALWPDQAPVTVLNFVELAEGTRAWRDPRTGLEVQRRFYDGLTFHRVIPRFMIQGGDPLASGKGGPGYKFEDEIVPGLVFDRPGLLAMANAGRDTNGSQFFVTEGAVTSLNGKHTIFGACEELEVVKEIARVESDASDKPLSPVTIRRVTITRGAR
ncbi:MAG: peptidylprolyl isomerase [Proteobacteria bacterium]|nr:peptidylprolyl isomerase [Pseudomonadota bacterium]MCP4919626.1 peptidylprolyl isomerase [Pseudomonadota bacterium]